MQSYTITPTTALAAVKSAAAAVGATLPPGLTDEADRLTAAAARLRDHRADRQALAAAVLAALEDGRDPSEDEAVVREVTRQSLYTLGIGAALEDHKTGRVRAALVEQLPAILKAFAPVVKAADKTLRTARESLPGVRLEDTHAATSLQPSQLAVWGQARGATDHLSRVVGAVSALLQAVGQTNVTQAYTALILAPLSAEQLRAIGADPRRVYLTGEPLSLADATEYCARVARVEADKAREAELRRAEAQYQMTGRRRQVAV